MTRRKEKNDLGRHREQKRRVSDLLSETGHTANLLRTSAFDPNLTDGGL